MGNNRLACSAHLTVLAIAASVVAAVQASPARARQKTATTDVYLRVTSTCRVETNQLDFGFPPKGAKTAAAATTITLHCTPGANYRVGIDDGQYFDGTTRRMYGGQANGQVWYVDYSLYHDAAGLIPWGNGPLDIALGTMPPTGSVTLPVFGVAELKNVRASEYRDTVTVVLEF